MRSPALAAAALALVLQQSAKAETPPGGSGTGPVVELAPEDRDTPPPKKKPLISFGAGHAPDDDVFYGLSEQRFRSAAESLARTSIGGYGELTVTGLSTGGANRVWTADARRVVLFVAHSFTDSIRVYTELEVEHAKEAEMEQAYLDWKFLGDYVGLRSGLILVPVGITNEVHEPPIFNGVQRPTVETVVIPTTWREIGIGFFGRPIESVHYELYAMAGLDPLGFTSSGFAQATGSGEVSKAKAWALAGRVEYEPLLGVVLGASGYVTDAGQNGNFYTRTGHETDLRLPVIGFSLDARVRRHGLEAKVLFSQWNFPNSGLLEAAYQSTGAPVLSDKTQPIPTVMRGAYAELGYNVFHPTRISHELVPFVRVEAYDTQAAVPSGLPGNPTYQIEEATMGASYRPIREIVFKADMMLRHRHVGPNESQANFGIGFMY